MKSPRATITTSWDDGHPLDVKLSSLLKKYSIEGTFYVPIRNWANESITLEDLKVVSNNFEIGGHTYNHAILSLIPNYRMDIELKDSKKWLENTVKKEIISFCYPLGQYNREIMQHVREAGYKGARTSGILNTSFSDMFEYHPTVQAATRKLLSMGKWLLKQKDIRFMSNFLFTGIINKSWNIVAMRTLDYVLERGGIWHLWGHSWEIEQNNDWKKLERVLEYAHQKGNEYKAEFLTNGDIFREGRKF